MRFTGGVILPLLAIVIWPGNGTRAEADDLPAQHFALNRINAGMVARMREAWELAGRGSSNREAAVLIVDRGEGTYDAVLAQDPEGYRSMRMMVPAGSVAIFHTHPNFTGSEPSPQDRLNSDLLGIPNFTLTDRGVWIYDPHTQRTSRVMYRLSWLDPKNWSREFGSAQEAK
jgi:hypothetical protein